MKGLLFSSITPSFIYMTGYKEVTEVCTTPFIYLDGSMYEVLTRSLVAIKIMSHDRVEYPPNGFYYDLSGCFRLRVFRFRFVAIGKGKNKKVSV